ncbi:MAG TPA: DUF302 domain-containing protein [Steroidobacteraceae bacterium]|nr:DUF302 domain-containing protein [Steroidobacteraceae bacterium]
MDSPAATSESGVVRIASSHTVAETVVRLEGFLRERGVIVFARIDFSGDAARAGLTMRPEQMLVFGNPKAGTPLMEAEPTAGLDLPIKALVFEDAAGKTWIAWNDPHYIVRRHGLPASLAANLASVVPLIERAAAA